MDLGKSFKCRDRGTKVMQRLLCIGRNRHGRSEAKKALEGLKGGKTVIKLVSVEQLC